MHYMHRQWPKLVRVLDDGRVPLDTNLVENAIRPFVVGRKAWLFADTMAGARASENTPINVIQQQLGHSNISTTHVYLCKIAPQQVIDTMQKREWSL